MRESHGLLMSAWELERQAEPDPFKERETLEQADRLWIVSLYAREEPWRLSHTVLMICFGVVIILGFAAMCTDVIARLAK